MLLLPPSPAAHAARVPLYHRAYGGGGSGGDSAPSASYMVLPNVPLRLSDVATLARCPGNREFSVWPAPLYDMLLLTPEHRRRAHSPAPFRDLTALTTRAGVAGVHNLLSLVPCSRRARPPRD
jgi:hypothetical protein